MSTSPGPALASAALERPLLRPRPRSKYLALAVCSLQRMLVWRSTLVLYLLTSFIWVLIQYTLWRGLFSVQPRVGPFDWQAMQMYLLLSFTVNALLSSSTEWRMFEHIRQGDVVFELARPVSYLGSQLAQASGAALVEGGLAALVTAVLAATLLEVSWPATPGMSLVFAVSVMLGFVIKFLFSYLVALLCFRLLNFLGLLWVRVAVSNIFSGALVPLELLPEPLRTAAWVLPFRGIVHTPLSVCLGLREDAVGLGLALLHQLLWVGLLWGLSRWMLAASLRGLTIQRG